MSSYTERTMPRPEKQPRTRSRRVALADHSGTGKVIPTMFVMVGLPAAGKTTRAKERAEAEQALRLTPDEWMIPLFGESMAGGKRNVLEGRFIWLALDALRKGINVVLDFGVWSRDERTALRFLAASVGASCTIEYLEVDEVEQRDRRDGRALSDAQTTFLISDDDLSSYRETFQEPDETELEPFGMEPPPAGHATWTSWVSDWWPTSI
jgi:predicted kinase